jgi:hypothetical protein
VRTVIELGESLLTERKYYAVTKRITESNKAIRSKGEHFVEYRARPGSASVTAGTANANPSLGHVSTALGHLNLQTEEEQKGAGADFLAGSDASSSQPRPADCDSARPHSSSEQRVAEHDSSSLAEPAPIAARPYTVLFVGANSEGGAFLNIESECEKAETALKLERGADAWKGLVVFHADRYATAATLMRRIQDTSPAVLLPSY